MELQREDVRIFYQDEGEGQPCVLVHGHTLDHRAWGEVTPHLVAAGWRVLRPDLRGHGRSSRPERGYHWMHHAADIAAVMQHAGVERAKMVGFSLGGGIVLEMAVTAPELVDSLVLVAPVMPDRPFEPAFLDNLKAVARSIRTEGVAAAMRGPWAESPLFAPSLERPGIRDRLLAIVGDFPGADYLATERDRVQRDWSIPDRLADIAAPTRVVVGGRDMPGFRAYAEEAATGIKGATLRVFDDCGHLLPFERPQQLAEVILS